MKIGTIDFEETDLMKGWGPIAVTSRSRDYKILPASRRSAFRSPGPSRACRSGVQFVGRFGEEHLLLQLAAQIEKTEPWNQKRPRVYG